MSFFPCSICEDKPRGVKLASLYWAWYAGVNNERRGWKQVLCKTCLIEKFGRLFQNASSASGETDSCFECAGELGQNPLVVYCKLYLPKQAERSFELPVCAMDAATLTGNILLGATRLPDRSSTGPTPSQDGAWSELPF